MAGQKTKGAYEPLREELRRQTTEALYQPQEYSKRQPPISETAGYKPSDEERQEFRDDVDLGWYEVPGNAISGNPLYRYDFGRAYDEGQRLIKTYADAGIPLDEQSAVRLAYAAQAREMINSGKVAPRLKAAVERHANFAPELEANQALAAKKARLPYAPPSYVPPDAVEYAQRIQDDVERQGTPRPPVGQDRMTPTQKFLDTTTPRRTDSWRAQTRHPRNRL